MHRARVALLALPFVLVGVGVVAALFRGPAAGAGLQGIHKIKHVVIVMRMIRCMWRTLWQVGNKLGIVVLSLVLDRVVVSCGQKYFISLSYIVIL